MSAACLRYLYETGNYPNSSAPPWEILRLRGDYTNALTITAKEKVIFPYWHFVLSLIVSVVGQRRGWRDKGWNDIWKIGTVEIFELLSGQCELDKIWFSVYDRWAADGTYEKLVKLQEQETKYVTALMIIENVIGSPLMRVLSTIESIPSALYTAYQTSLDYDVAYGPTEGEDPFEFPKLHPLRSQVHLLITKVEELTKTYRKWGASSIYGASDSTIGFSAGQTRGGPIVYSETVDINQLTMEGYFEPELRSYMDDVLEGLKAVKV
jgi:hypothetical protein